MRLLVFCSLSGSLVALACGSGSATTATSASTTAAPAVVSSLAVGKRSPQIGDRFVARSRRVKTRQTKQVGAPDAPRAETRDDLDVQVTCLAVVAGVCNRSEVVVLRDKQAEPRPPEFGGAASLEGSYVFQRQTTGALPKVFKGETELSLDEAGAVIVETMVRDVVPELQALFPAEVRVGDALPAVTKYFEDDDGGRVTSRVTAIDTAARTFAVSIDTKVDDAADQFTSRLDQRRVLTISADTGLLLRDVTGWSENTVEGREQTSSNGTHTVELEHTFKSQ